MLLESKDIRQELNKFIWICVTIRMEFMKAGVKIFYVDDSLNICIKYYQYKVWEGNKIW